MRTRIGAMTIAAITALSLTVVPLGAEDAGIGIDTVDFATGEVNGTVVFPQVDGPQDVGGAKDAGAAGGSPLGEAAGLNLQQATIDRLGDGSGLRFTWHIEGMPEEVPPEGVRYNWAFRIGQTIYQLQAKRTNMANSTTAEDPVGHVQHLADGNEFFQLRGACTAEYLGTPVNGCYHLAFLDGAFDTEAGTVTIDVPWETRDAIGRLVAPDLVPGAALMDNGGEASAQMTVAASLQAAVSNTHVSQWLNGIRTYFSGPTVQAGVGTLTANPASVAYKTEGTVTDGVYTVTAPTPNANQTIYVRACDGLECVYARADR